MRRQANALLAGGANQRMRPARTVAILFRRQPGKKPLHPLPVDFGGAGERTAGFTGRRLRDRKYSQHDAVGGKDINL